MSIAPVVNKSTLIRALAQIDALCVCEEVYVGEPVGFCCLDYYDRVRRGDGDFSALWAAEVLSGARLCSMCTIKQVVRNATAPPSGCHCLSYFARVGSHAQGCPLHHAADPSIECSAGEQVTAARIYAQAALICETAPLSEATTRRVMERLGHNADIDEDFARMTANPPRHYYGWDATPQDWPWPASLWSPSADPVVNLTLAMALLAAEIERLSAIPVSEGPAPAVSTPVDQ